MTYPPNQNLRASFQEMLLQQDYSFFLTITFNRYSKELNSDKNLIFILRFINKKLFGKRHLDKDTYLRYFLVRGKVLSGLSHYHLLLEHPGLDFEDLVDAFIECTHYAECLDPINEDDREGLTTDKNSLLPEFLSHADEIKHLGQSTKIHLLTENPKMMGHNKVQRRPKCNLVKIKNLTASTTYLYNHCHSFGFINWSVSGKTSEGYYHINTRK